MEALATSLRGDLDQTAADMADLIHAETPSLDEDLRPMTRESCRANIAMIVSMLSGDADPEQATGAPEAMYYAQEYARRDLGLEALLKAYRLGHQHFFTVWLERLRELAPTVQALAEATQYSSNWLFAYIDAVTHSVAATYELEREGRVRTSAAIRAQGVRELLSGAAVDRLELSRRLNYELDRRHVAFVVWAEPAEPRAVVINGLERLAETIATRLGDGPALLVPQGGLRVDGWVPLSEDAQERKLGRSDDAAALHARVAVGLPAHGLDGFGRSHRDALAAQRVALSGHRSAGTCVHFEDVQLLDLLTADEEGARRFVEAELGGLSGEADAVRRIAATAQAFLDERSSYKHTGQRLGIHENTVAYRIKRAEELLGRELNARRLELHVALRLLELLRRR